MTHPLDGIREKLKRADECIRNLDSEIAPFMAKFPIFDYPVVNSGIDPIFTDEHRRKWKQFGSEFLKVEQENRIPPRFAILAGEIVHHLRSCFDHLAWQLSDATCRNTGTNAIGIEFPIFITDPASDKEKLRLYRRKVQCIVNRPNALARIETLQPYKSADPVNSLIWRIHEMDRINKHRELTIVISAPGAYVEAAGLWRSVPIHKAGIPIGKVSLPGILSMALNAKVRAYVTFGQSSKGEFQPAVPFLQQLHSFTITTIEAFAGDFA